MSTHYVLKIQYVNKPVETRNIEAPVTVLGREAGDIVLGDPQASGRHAEIHFQNGQVSVKDLGSTNGTFFNGQRSMSFQVGPGQSFSIGQTVLTVMAVHGAAAQKGPAKTMIAMGGMPPRPPGPGAPPGAPPPGPSGFGAPPPASQPPSSGGFGAPVGSAAGVGGKLGGAGAPPPGPSQPQGFGQPPSQPPGQSQPQGFGPPPGQSQPQGFGQPQAQPPGQAQPQGFGQPQSQPPGQSQPQGFGQPQPPGQSQPQGFGQPQGPGSSQPGQAPPGQSNPYGAPGGGGAPPPQSNPGAMAPAAAAAGGAIAAAASSAPAGQAPQSISIPSGTITPKFHGTGGEVFGQLFVGGLLTVITLGIYTPWFMVKLINYVMTKTEISGTAKGTLKGSFTGTGGQLFVHFLVGYLLMIVTLGIYAPWFICRMLRWGAENFTLTADDGSTYKLRFDGTGGALFGTFILGAILMIITLYIYTPWFLVKLRKWLYSHMAIMENGQEVGKLDFEGTGGSLFGTAIVGVLLTAITLYIYYPWFQVSLKKYWASNTRIHVHGRTIHPDFVGTGGQLFVIGLLAVLLGPITLGIYYFWVIAKLLRFNIEGHEFKVVAGGQPALQA